MASTSYFTRLVSNRVLLEGAEVMRALLMAVRASLYFMNFLILLVIVPLAWTPLGAGRAELRTLVKLAARNTFRIFGVSWSIRGQSLSTPTKIISSSPTIGLGSTRQ